VVPLGTRFQYQRSQTRPAFEPYRDSLPSSTLGLKILDWIFDCIAIGIFEITEKLVHVVYGFVRQARLMSDEKAKYKQVNIWLVIITRV
jgi:hypothetical protein